MWNTIKQYFTTAKSISFTHKWTIKNFSRLYDEAHPWKWKICSDRFAPPNNEQFIFSLSLYQKGESENFKDCVSLGVYVYDMPQKYDGKIECQWNVSIEDSNGNMHQTEEKKRCLIDNEATIFTFIQYSKLLNSSSQYLPNDQLTLYFSIHLISEDRIFNVITNNEVGWSQFDCANKVTTVQHTWTIENFTDMFNEGAVAPNWIQSDHFPGLDQQNERFCLSLHPFGCKEGRNNYMDIAIVRNDNENSATVHWRISILNVDGEECLTQEWTEKIDWINSRYIDYNRAFLLDNSNGLLVDNKLKVYFKMSYMMDDLPKTTTSTKMMDSVHKSESLYDVANKAIHYVSHRWTIDKFHDLCHNSPMNHYIISPTFQPPTDTRFSFHLRLWPNGSPKCSMNYLSLDLVNVSLHTNQVTVQYRISLLDANEQKFTNGFDQLSISKYDKTRMVHFFNRDKLQNPFLSNNFFPTTN